MDTSAPHGTNGTLLLDPQDALITANAGPGIVTVASIQAALATGDVVVTTGSTGSDAGDLTVAASISWATTSALTLSAYRNINVNANITNTNSNGALVNLHADNTGTGVGTVSFGAGATISTRDYVSIFFNPTVNPVGSSINPTSYVNPIENYSSKITGGVLIPYMLVNSLNDLQNIQNNLSGAYALGKNIEASTTVGWNNGAGFAPIGDQAHPFRGLFDGEGRTINGLYINSSSTDVGLFGVSTGALFGVGLTNVNVTSTSTSGVVGALVGSAALAYISPSFNLNGVYGSYATGSVTGTGLNSIAGGLVGQSPLSIDSSYASVNVNGVYVAGGLVGWNVGAGIVSSSYATGTVVAGVGNGTAAAAGGLVGVNDGYIYQSYSTGAVSVAMAAAAPLGNGGYAGGLVGFNNGLIFQSYSTGQVSGPGTLGGLAAYSFIDSVSYLGRSNVRSSERRNKHIIGGTVERRSESWIADRLQYNVFK